MDGKCADGSTIQNRRVFVQWSVVDQETETGRLLIITPQNGTCGSFQTAIRKGDDDSGVTFHRQPDCQSVRQADGTEIVEVLLKGFMTLSDTEERLSIVSMDFKSRASQPSAVCEYSVSGDLFRRK